MVEVQNVFVVVLDAQGRNRIYTRKGRSINNIAVHHCTTRKLLLNE